MKFWNIISKKIKGIKIFHYSIIPLFLLIILVSSLILTGCAGSDRFSKNDSDSKSLEVIKGVASYYSEEFHGRKTANGETYDMYALTAAHKIYPFNTKVRVTNLANGKSVVLRINDRMPNYNKRIIDISFQAARDLGMLVSGIADVKIEVLEWGE